MHQKWNFASGAVLMAIEEEVLLQIRIDRCLLMRTSLTQLQRDAEA